MSGVCCNIGNTATQLNSKHSQFSCFINEINNLYTVSLRYDATKDKAGAYYHELLCINHTKCTHDIEVVSTFSNHKLHIPRFTEGFNENFNFTGVHQKLSG
jgi:hypothetical protein